MGSGPRVEIGDDYYLNMAADYQKKRDILADALSEAVSRRRYRKARTTCSRKSRTTSRRQGSGAGAARNTRVASVPGSAFFVSEAGKRMLRFCFAKDFDSLEEACKRIRAFKPAAVQA